MKLQEKPGMRNHHHNLTVATDTHLIRHVKRRKISDPIRIYNDYGDQDYHSNSLGQNQQSHLPPDQSSIVSSIPNYQSIQSTSRVKKEIKIDKSQVSLRSKISNKVQSSRTYQQRSVMDAYLTYVENPVVNTSQLSESRNTINGRSNDNKKLKKVMRKYQDPEELRQFLSNQIKFKFDLRHQEILEKYQKIKNESIENYQRYQENSLPQQDYNDKDKSIEKQRSGNLLLPSIQTTTRNIYGLSIIGISNAKKKYSSLNYDDDSQERSITQSYLAPNDNRQKERSKSINKAIGSVLDSMRLNNDSKFNDELYPQIDQNISFKENVRRRKPRRQQKTLDPGTERIKIYSTLSIDPNISQKNLLEKQSKIKKQEDSMVTQSKKRRHNTSKEKIMTKQQIREKKEKLQKKFIAELMDPKIQKKLLLIQKRNETLIEQFSIDKNQVKIKVATTPLNGFLSKSFDFESKSMNNNEDLENYQRSNKNLLSNLSTSSLQSPQSFLKQSNSVDDLKLKPIRIQINKHSKLNDHKLEVKGVDHISILKQIEEYQAKPKELKELKIQKRTELVSKKQYQVDQYFIRKQLKQQAKEERIQRRNKFKQLMGFDISREINQVENNMSNLQQLILGNKNFRKLTTLKLPVDNQNDEQDKKEEQNKTASDPKKPRVNFDLSKNTIQFQ